MSLGPNQNIKLHTITNCKPAMHLKSEYIIPTQTNYKTSRSIGQIEYFIQNGL